MRKMVCAISGKNVLSKDKKKFIGSSSAPNYMSKQFPPFLPFQSHVYFQKRKEIQSKSWDQSAVDNLWCLLHTITMEEQIQTNGIS